MPCKLHLTPARVRSNIVFYVALGALGAVGLLALLATGRVSPQNVLGLLIALSNAFGLIAGARGPRVAHRSGSRGSPARQEAEDTERSPGSEDVVHPTAVSCHLDTGQVRHPRTGCRVRVQTASSSGALARPKSQKLLGQSARLRPVPTQAYS